MKVKPSFWNIFFAISTIVLVKPNYIDSIPVLDKVITVLGILVFLLELYIYFSVVKHIEGMFWVTVLFASVPLLSTVFNDGNLFSAFSLWSHYIGIYILCKLETIYRRDALYSITLPIVFLFVVTNFLTMIIFPNGMYQVVRTTGWTSNQAWFLGLRNSHSFWMMLLCMIFYMKYNSCKKRLGMFIEAIIVVVVTVYSLLNNGGSGALVAAILICFYIIFRNYLFKFSLHYVYLFANAFFFLFVVVLQAHEYILRNIVESLNRDVTFTGRTYVWKAALAWWQKSPIWGWGIENDLVILRKIGVTGDTAFIKCHNLCVDLLYSGGIVTLILFICMILLIIYKNKKTDARIFSCVAWFLFFATFLLGQTETAIISNVVILMINIAYFAGEWVLPQEKKKKIVIRFGGVQR